MKTHYFHIIISPPIEHREEFVEPDNLYTISAMLKKHTKEYAIATEKGSSLDFTHFDIWANFNKGHDSTDIRRKLKTCLKKYKGPPYELDFQSSIFIKIVTIKDPDPYNLIGYTFKEEGLKDFFFQGSTLTKFKCDNPEELIQNKIMVVKEKQHLALAKTKHRAIRLKAIIREISLMIARQELEKKVENWTWNLNEYTYFLYKIQKNGNLLNWTSSEEQRCLKYFKTYYSEDSSLDFKDIVEDCSNYQFIEDEPDQYPSFPPVGASTNTSPASHTGE